MRSSISRREFLKLMSAIIGTGLVSACSPLDPTATPSTTSNPTLTPSQIPSPSATPTPLPVPLPEPVNTNFDVLAIYLHGRGISEEDSRTGYGYATVEPLYGEGQTILTMMMDIKWAREHSITTFLMPVAYPDTTWERRLDEMFLAANTPPYEIDYAVMFNPEPYMPWSDSHYSLETGLVKTVKEFISKQIEHPRYKRLPDGRPLVMFYFAQVFAWFLGLDELEKTADLLRNSFDEDIFLVGDVMQDAYTVKSSPEYKTPGFISRQVKPFDAISCYYMWRAGYEWNNQEEWDYVTSPFPDMITGYREACELWGEEAYKQDVKFVAPIAPTGVSNRLLYEAGFDDWLVDRHDGVSYKTSKEMAEVGASYADPELKMILVGAWNECNEGAAVVPSKQFGFEAIHAVRDTFAIEPPGGWPRDYYPSL